MKALGFLRTLLGLLAFAAAGAGAATLTVTTVADEIDTPTGPQTSLREAIRDAASGDTIVFAPGLSGATITLGGTQLLLDKSLTIDASALPAGITLNGNAASRIFQVNSGPTVVLTALTIANGAAGTSDGGGIGNHGMLTVNQCILTGNTALGSGAGIYNSGTLTVNQSTLTNNVGGNNAFLGAGGGIYNHSTGTLTVNQSTLSDNRGGRGGGINNLGMLTVNQSTLSGDSADYGGEGGGIYNDSTGTLTVNQSTITGCAAYEHHGLCGLRA